jgi:hypothetical protein
MPCDLLLPSLLFPTIAYQQVCWEGASYIIKRLQPTPYSLVSLLVLGDVGESPASHRRTR